MKMKFPLLWSLIFISITGFCVNSNVSAQEKSTKKKAEEHDYGWQKEMVGGLNLTQTCFDNWAQGGENTFTWQLNLNFNFKNDREKTTWANSCKFTYGSAKTGKQESRKSIDEIKLESVLTYKLGVLINPYVAMTGETQFGPGYNYATEPEAQISAFMDPGYFRESFGVGYQPNKIVKTRLGISLKQTVTSDYPIPYADDPETMNKIEKNKNEVGSDNITDLNWKITGNTIYISKTGVVFHI